MQHITSIKQFTDKRLLTQLFTRAAELQAMAPAEYPKPLQHLTLATIFFEPSTRTRLSFETAIQNLGGHVISVENAAEFSSAKKGESLADTIRTLSAYADGIIIRHPEIGSAEQAAVVSDVPVINAGDGGGEHPTQALLDAYSIHQALGTIDNLHIALVGDLLHSRTHHSLLQLLTHFKVTLSLIAPKSISLPPDLKAILTAQKVKFTEFQNWQNVIAQLDVLYINRIQKERFATEAEYHMVKDDVSLSLKDVALMKRQAIILDPLPRVHEIAEEVDADPRARYFQQVENGLYMRMALLEYLYS